MVGGHHFDSPSDLARETAFKIYYTGDREQEMILSSLVETRHQLATLCGYETFAHRAVSSSLAQTPENISQFLTSLAAQMEPRLEAEYLTMTRMKEKSCTSGRPLAVWDLVRNITFLPSKVLIVFICSPTSPPLPNITGSVWTWRRSRNISPSEQSWRYVTDQSWAENSPGFYSQGLNELFQNIYGVELVVETPEEGELWDSEVTKLAVRDSDNLLGYIYCDFYRRKGKPFQDCHFTIRGGREQKDGSYQDPVVVLMLNLVPPTRTCPTLLSPGTLDNLFHEMGHAMHSMLGRTKYQHVTGTRCSTDFAEVPSTLMEYFASDPRVLARINSHYKTGQKLPEQIIQVGGVWLTLVPHLTLDFYQNLSATKKIFCATELQAQLFYSCMDGVFHGRHPLAGDLSSSVRELQEKCHTLPGAPDAAYHHRFSHLVGYGARYYSYMLARSVASAIWQKSFLEDPFSRAQGDRYRTECLSHGGGKPSHTLVGDYLGCQLTPQQLSEALIQELDMKNDQVQQALRAQ